MEHNLVTIKNEYPTLLRDISFGLVPKELHPYVAPALEKFKNEIAEELGIDNYDNVDKGELSSRMNGSVGGNMTKKMVKFSEAVLAYMYKQQLTLKD